MDIYFVVTVTSTFVSVGCAFFSLIQTRKQTHIMQEQLDEAKKPNFPLSMKLEGVTKALYKINETLASSKDHNRTND